MWSIVEVNNIIGNDAKYFSSTKTHSHFPIQNCFRRVDKTLYQPFWTFSYAYSTQLIKYGEQKLGIWDPSTSYQT